MTAAARGAGARGESSRSRREAATLEPLNPAPAASAARSPMDVPRARRRRRWPVLLGAAIAAGGALALAARSVLASGPAVPRTAVIVGQVRRGSLHVVVRGSGRLVPESVRYVTAIAAGRVERVLVRPGATVDPDAALLSLSNPEIELQALQAEQEALAVETQLIELRRNLEILLATHEVDEATALADHGAAQRDAEIDAKLAERGVIAREQARRSAERLAVATRRLEAERGNVALLLQTSQQQLHALEAQRANLRKIAEQQRQRVASMGIRAGVAGVVEDLNLQPGQWVQAGQQVARVVQQGHLRADLRVPQGEARDVAPGQPVAIDTRREVIAGRVRRVSPNVEAGFVRVEVGLEGELPRTARPELSVDGTITVDALRDVLVLPRPAAGGGGDRLTLFKLRQDGREAVRVAVQLGHASALDVEVRSGLEEGDQVIVSDTSAWERSELIHLK